MAPLLAHKRSNSDSHNPGRYAKHPRLSDSSYSSHDSDSDAQDQSRPVGNLDLLRRLRNSRSQPDDDETSSSDISSSPSSSSQSRVSDFERGNSEIEAIGPSSRRTPISASSLSYSRSPSFLSPSLRSSDEGNVISLPRRLKLLKPTAELEAASGIRDRLRDFLPALRAANEELQKRLARGELAKVEVDDEESGEDEDGTGPSRSRDEGQVVEMNLGLGVLEEKRKNESLYSDSVSSSSSDTISDRDDSSEPDPIANDSQHPATSDRHHSKKEQHILQKLMGNKSGIKKPSIEEVG